MAQIHYFTEKIGATRKELPQTPATFWHCTCRLCLNFCSVGELFVLLCNASLTASALDPAPLLYSRTSLWQLSISIESFIFLLSLDHCLCLKYIIVFLIYKKILPRPQSSFNWYHFPAPLYSALHWSFFISLNSKCYSVPGFSPQNFSFLLIPTPRGLTQFHAFKHLPDVAKFIYPTWTSPLICRLLYLTAYSTSPLDSQWAS